MIFQLIALLVVLATLAGTHGLGIGFIVLAVIELALLVPLITKGHPDLTPEVVRWSVVTMSVELAVGVLLIAV